MILTDTAERAFVLHETGFHFAEELSLPNFVLSLVAMFYKTVVIWLCQIVYPLIAVKYKEYNFL